MVDVAVKADEFSEGAVVDIAEAGTAVQTPTAAVKLDITTLLSVELRPSGDQDSEAEMRVSERESSDGVLASDPLVAVSLSVVPETVRAGFSAFQGQA